MSATLIAVIFALALGHLAPGLAMSVRQYDWFGVWLRWLNARGGGSGGDTDGNAGFWRGRYGIVLALLPPVLLVGLFQYALHSPLAGVVGLVFGVAVLFHVWGPRDLDADVSAVIDAEDPAARRAAAIRLGAAQSGANPESGLGEPAAMVEGVFASALRRWFARRAWALTWPAKPKSAASLPLPARR